VLVLGVTTDDVNSLPELACWAAFVSASSFEPVTAFCAAFAFLLGLFFSFAISVS
jgi:hypothetical protein